MDQHLLSNGPLLNDNGNLCEAGYAFSLVKDYKRSAIKANKLKIKEWDYYFIHDDKYGVALTMSDNSYLSLMSVSVIDFINKKEWTKSYIEPLSVGSVSFPSSSKTGNVFHESKKFNMLFKNDNGRRRLVVFFKNLVKGVDFKCDIHLSETTPNSMVIATPFDKPKHFYYNQKINLLKANGSFSFGTINHNFSKDTYGVLDWGRGVWTYANTWYWSSINGIYKGHRIGLNLGYGFGNTTAATENMFFYDNKAFKLDDVKFNIPTTLKGKEDYLKPWTITSKSGDIDLFFEPLLDRYANSNALIVQSIQHQIFGRFSGKIKVGEKTYEIKNLIGFAEKVKNRW